MRRLREPLRRRTSLRRGPHPADLRDIGHHEYQEEQPMNLTELRTQLEDLERKGYGEWEVDLSSELPPDKVAVDEWNNYRVCGVADPAYGDNDAGYVMLTFELVPRA
jgi:hypothetical protein